MSRKWFPKKGYPPPNKQKSFLVHRLLTLPSGWRIQFGNNVNFVFETHDLSNASPATISRMGIVNLSEADLNPSILIEAWLKKQTNPNGMQYFMDDFNRSVDVIVKLKNKSLKSKVGLINAGLEFVGDCVSKEQFCVELARGLGSTLRQEDRNQFCLNVSFVQRFFTITFSDSCCQSNLRE